MRKVIWPLIFIALISFLAVSCSEKLTGPTEPLKVKAYVVPDSIPLGYYGGLYAEISGGVPPYRVYWVYGCETVSTSPATAYKFDRLGSYLFWLLVGDADNNRSQDFVWAYCVPLDSIKLPPDTVHYPDTIKVPLPPDTVIVHDTTIIRDTTIIKQIDTTIVIDTIVKFDTTIMVDTLIVPDTIVHVDTLIRFDTVKVIDSIPIVDTVTVIQYDTVFSVDTLIQHDTTKVVDTIQVVDTLIYTIVDTVYLPVKAIAEEECWEIDYQNLTAKVQLHNPAGWYQEIIFNWIRKDPPLDGKGFYLDAGGQSFPFAVTLASHQISRVGGEAGVYLEENASISLRLDKLVYLPKEADGTCYEYLKGCYWWLIPKVK